MLQVDDINNNPGNLDDLRDFLLLTNGDSKLLFEAVSLGIEHL